MSSSSSESGGPEPPPVPLTAETKAFIAAVASRPKLQDVPVEVGRQNVEASLRVAGGPFLPLRRVEDLSIPSPAPPLLLPVRVYLPTLSPPTPLPVLLYSHGGGWVVGSIAGYDQCCRRLASLGNVVVVSVDYRLSPEHRYPAALDDVEAAYIWAVTTLAAQYPQVVDPEQGLVAGDSAGGNLSAGLIVRLHRKDRLPSVLRPKAQVLIYPSLDFTLTGPSHRTFAHGHVLTADLIQWFMRHYLGSKRYDSHIKASDPELSPLLVPTPWVFPPTLLLAAEADPLVDDSHALYRRMTTRGEGFCSPVELVVYRGVPHGFFTSHEAFPEARQAMAHVTHYLSHRAWRRPPASRL